MKQNPKTIKQILNISFLSVSIPALILLLVLTCYTISRQIHADQSDTEIQLSQVTTHMEEVLKRSETQLNNLVVPGSPFQRYYRMREAALLVKVQAEPVCAVAVAKQ